MEPAVEPVANRRAGMRWAWLAVFTLAAVLGCRGAAGPAGSTAPWPEEAGGRGVWHEVVAGETLYAIARAHQASIDAVLAANEIEDVRDLPIGTRLWIPLGQAGVRPVVPRRGGPPTPAPPPGRHPRVSGTPEFGWPLRGKLTSPFGERGRTPHEGIDVAARRGTLVRAAEAGRVVFSGRLGDYGLAVVVRHDERHATVYAHHLRNRVEQGSFVDKGDVVGEVGTSGNASGPHLHFEIRRDGRPLDPLALLP